jgi:hypothetical protein
MLTSPLSSGSAAEAGPGTQAGTDTREVAGREAFVPPEAGRRWQRIAGALGPVGWPIAVYCFSRVLLLAVAAVPALVSRHALAPEFFRFDGQWYLRLAEHGYPTRPLHAKSTLGFMPLYPAVIRGLAVVPGSSVPRAALIVSLAGGLAAALLVQRLAAGWWGEQAARRATVVFCLFPGSIVFSMAYSEGLAIPLALGCLLALGSRRWWLAGLLAGLATAAEPVALVLVAVCLAAAGRELHDRGWRDPVARRSLAAPLLAPLGIGAFGVFLWAWTGTPLAAIVAQHYGWHQQGQPLALLALPVTRHLLGHPPELLAHLFTWNIWNGVLGGIFLGFSIAALARVRRELSPGALVLTAGIAAVTLWSVMTPPNVRMVLIAFPAVLVWGRRLAGRGLGLFVSAEAVVFVLASGLTYTGLMLP